MLFQLFLLVLVIVGLVLMGWAFMSTKKKAKENNNDNEDKENKEPNDCTMKKYAGQDNDAVSPCEEEGCRLEDTKEEECKAACCAMEKCKAVQWRSTDGRCLLKASVGDINDAKEEKTLYVKQ